MLGVSISSYPYGTEYLVDLRLQMMLSGCTLHCKYHVHPLVYEKYAAYFILLVGSHTL